MGALAGGMSKVEAARVFGMGRATLKRYARQQRETGSLTPRHAPGGVRLIGAREHEALIAQWTAHPDAPLDEHSRLWEEATGQRVSVATMCRMEQRLGWTRKKSPSGPASGTRRPAPLSES